MANVNITEDKHRRVTEMQIGDTVFTVISVESSRARERLYDKVKRMIMDSETAYSSDMPPAA